MEACLQTLRLCVQITRDLVSDAEKMNGAIALTALAGVFDEMIGDLILSLTPEQGTS